jgi:hypothetical protein
VAHRDVRHQFEGLEDDVHRAIAVRPPQLVPDVPVRRQRQAIFRDGRPTDVSAQPFELLALIRPRRNTGVQGEPGHLADPGIEVLRAGGCTLKIDHQKGGMRVEN